LHLYLPQLLKCVDQLESKTECSILTGVKLCTNELQEERFPHQISNIIEPPVYPDFREQPTGARFHGHHRFNRQRLLGSAGARYRFDLSRGEPHPSASTAISERGRRPCQQDCDPAIALAKRLAQGEQGRGSGPGLMKMRLQHDDGDGNEDDDLFWCVLEGEM